MAASPMEEHFLLDTELARRLYGGHAKGLPIIDFASHLELRDIVEDKRYRNLAEAWMRREPSRERLLRSGGVGERYITGEAPAREKFRRYAEMLPRAVGHPLQLWSWAELGYWFGCEEPLSPRTADGIWDRASEALAGPGMSACGMLRRANVSALMLREDPASDLKLFRRIPEQCPARILPAYEADAAFRIDDPEWENYMLYTLGHLEEVDVSVMADVRAVLEKSMDLFQAAGCPTAILHFRYPFYREAREYELDDIVGRAIHGKGLPDLREREAYQTALLLHLAKECKRRKWVLQLTYDVMEGGSGSGADALHRLFGTLERMEWLPRCIVTSRNPADDDLFCRIAGTYHISGGEGTIQPGLRAMAMPEGIGAQLQRLAARSVLGALPGYAQRAWTFLEYPRQDIFRRALCRFLGQLSQGGECPADEDALGRMVEDLCYGNAVSFFRIEQ